MHTHRVVKMASERALAYAGLAVDERGHNLAAARAELDALLAAKSLAPLEVYDKLSRVGDKVVAAALRAGGDPAGVLAFARALPLPTTPYQRAAQQGLAASPAPASFAPRADVSRPAAAAAPSFGETFYAAPPPASQVTFQAGDGAVVTFGRALLAGADATLLARMTDGTWGDGASSDGHLQLPTLCGRQLELLRDHLRQQFDVRELVDADLARAERAADFVGCAALAQAATRERQQRRLAPLLSPTFFEQLDVDFELDDLRPLFAPFRRALAKQVLRATPQTEVAFTAWLPFVDADGDEWNDGPVLEVLDAVEVALMRAGFHDASVSRAISAGDEAVDGRDHAELRTLVLVRFSL